jgi:hypothetical protein
MASENEPSKAPETPPPKKRRYVEEIDLTPEEEAALEASWTKRNKDRGNESPTESEPPPT